MAILSTFAPYEMVIKLTVSFIDLKNNYIKQSEEANRAQGF